jgi:uncharacterized NAD(P)/FAD-binding protein YdhS
MPPDASAELDRLRTGDKLEILKGRLTDIRHDGTKFNISYRSDDLSKTVAADVLVNCIGSETDFSRIETPLIQSLLRRGLVRPDDLRLGLNATPDGNIIGDDGNPSRSLFTLGTALRGVLWESTAIPEIRLQARDLADRLLAA